MPGRSRGLLVAAMVAWVAVGAWTLVVHGIMDPDHLWAPYLGVVLFAPFWVVGAWAAVRLLAVARGRPEGAGARRWSVVMTVFGWIASIPFIDSLVRTVSGDPFATVNPEGFGLLGATGLVTAAMISMLREARIGPSAG